MFAATYVINLVQSTRRWTTMQPILDCMGFANRIRFEGVNGAALGEAGRDPDFRQGASIESLQQSGLLSHDLSAFDPGCLPGEIGCALSHAGVLRDIIKRGLPSALILEDDVWY